MPPRRVDQGRALRQAEQIARDSYDRIAGLVLRELAIDGCLTKAPGGERREEVIGAFFELADAIITVRSLIRQAWTLYRWDSRPARRP